MMIKRAFFIFVLFGVVLAGAMVTSASPTDPIEVVAATESDTPAPVTPDANAQTAIVNSEPIGCKYPDICPPPPPPLALCVGTVEHGPWMSDFKAGDNKGSFHVMQEFTFSHTGCGDGALSNVISGGSDVFTPTDKNPWSTTFAGMCNLVDGEWVLTPGVSNGYFEVVPANKSTNSPVPVVISWTAPDCLNSLVE